MPRHSKTHIIAFPIQGWLGIRVFICFAWAYLLSYGIRAINAIIAPDLIAELHISNSTLGAMSAAYFVGFFLMQIPLGHWLDQYGSRKSESFLLLFSVVGAVIFAMADQILILTLGRCLIGMGVSACLMSAFTYYGRWFRPEHQGPLASAMLMCGTAGAMLMTIPVQMALPIMGWRGIFWVLVIFLLIAVLGIRFGIPKATDPITSSSTEEEKSTKPLAWLQGYIPIIKSGNFLQMLPMGVFNQGGFYAIQTLWLGTWYRDVLQLSDSSVASHLFTLNLVLLVGYAANMFIPRILNKKGISTFTYAGILGGLSVAMEFFAVFLDPEYSSFFLLLFSLAATSFILAQSVFSQFFPSSISGKASTSFNMLIFGGAIIVQWGIGFFIDKFMEHGLDKVEALTLAFKIMILCQVASYIWMWLAPYVLIPSRFLMRVTEEPNH